MTIYYSPNRDAEDDYPNSQSTLEKYCYHSWEKYVGVIHVYEYCTKCDKKREDPSLRRKDPNEQSND